MILKNRIDELSISPATIVNNYITQVINTGSNISEEVLLSEETLPIYALLN